MKRIVFHLSRATRITLTVLVLFSAMALSVARFVVPMVDTWRADVEHQLSTILKARVELGPLTGEQNNFNPAIAVNGVTIYQADYPDRPSLVLDRLVLELDTLATLKRQEPVFRRLLVDGGELHLSGHPGGLRLEGYPKPIPVQSGPVITSSKPDISHFLGLLSRQQQIDIRDLRFTVDMPSGVTHTLSVQHMRVSGPPQAQRAEALINTPYGERLKLSVNLRGNISQWPDVIAQGYLSVPQMKFQHWLELLPEALASELQININDLQAGAELWFSHDPSGWNIRGSAVANTVDITVNNQQLPNLTALKTDLALSFGNQQSARLWLNNLQFNLGDQPWPKNNLFLEWQQDQLTIAADQLTLQPLAAMATASGRLPELLHQVIETLDPHGQLQNLALRLPLNEQGPDFQLRADLRQVAVEHWQGAPSGAHISGRLQMSANDGTLDLDSPGFTLGLDNVFDDIWVYDRVKGRLYWHINNDAMVLRTDTMSFTGGEGDINARLRLDIPFAEELPVVMALEAGIQNGDVAFTNKYLPVKEAMDQELADWLNSAVKSGGIDQGAFIFNGPLSDVVKPNDTSWGLFFDINNGAIAYSPDWPELTGLTGLVTVDQTDVRVTASQASVYQSPVRNLRAIVPNIMGDDPLVIHVQGQASASADNALRILRESPIATQLHDAANDWQFSGPVGVDLNLAIGLDKGSRDDIRVSIDLQDNSFQLPAVNLGIDKLSGRLNYSSAKGLYGQGIKGHLFGKPTTLAFSSRVSPDSHTTLIDLQGKMAMADLNSWLGFKSLESLLEGSTDYRARVTVANDVQVDINSNLNGVAINLPKPFAKQHTERKPVAVHIGIKPDRPLTLSATYNGLAFTEAELTRSGQPRRIGIHFGDNPNGLRLPEQGLLVNGHLDQLDLTPWIGHWQAGKTKDTDNSGLVLPVQVDNVTIDQLNWKQASLHKVSADAAGAPGNPWVLTLAAAEVEGMAIFPTANEPLTLNISRLNLPASILPQHQTTEDDQAQEHSSAAADDPLLGLDPAIFPATDVRVDGIHIGKQYFGALEFRLRPVNHGLKVMALRGELGAIVVDGSLDWYQQRGQHRTLFRSSLSSNRVGEMMSLWGYPEIITASSLKGDANLQWQGSPAGVSMAALAGDVELALNSGRFLSVDNSSSGALRLFGVLNVDAITRRLRLDFSDLFSSGMAFDRVQGRLAFDNGIITMRKPVSVEGPSSDFHLDGQLNVLDKTLDMGLIVTLPVTQNIAAVSLLLGQPYIAGAAFLFDKLLGSSVEQFASLRYEIRGSFAEPEIKLDRLFSNTPPKSGS